MNDGGKTLVREEHSSRRVTGGLVVEMKEVSLHLSDSCYNSY